MNFFLDIFNKILKINESDVMIIFDLEGNIWFKLKDVFIALGYTDLKKSIYKFNINKDYKKKYLSIKVPGSTPVPSNLQQTTLFVNESGLYEILSNSTKPLAKIFMDKYFKEIMPTIRKTGQYILNTNEKEKLDKVTPTEKKNETKF